jgi:3-oxoacyl-[acyl-carrier protein] reductase
MKVDLTGTVALVTGAGSGIGQAIAKLFAANGAAVIANDVTEQGGATVAAIEAAGGTALFHRCDVSQPAEVERMVTAAVARFGRIDTLVNNAGVGARPDRRRPVHEFDPDEWRRLIDVNLSSAFSCCRAVTPAMVERRAGVIINIASVVGQVPLRNQIAYAAAKAGVINFSRAAALELGPFGIRVNAIAPGSTLTAATAPLFYNPDKQDLAQSLLSHVPLGRPGTADDIAYGALFLAAPEASYITGTVLTIDGGWTAGFARDW